MRRKNAFRYTQAGDETASTLRLTSACLILTAFHRSVYLNTLLKNQDGDESASTLRLTSAHLILAAFDKITIVLYHAQQ